ncbi:hypothetical protein QN277_018991 [Acacia crassicarpa]|uniref:PHD finger protein ALFIN-LIKE n=1 Tax=Acacia crassicarpa TaxID=499986 RepID=A0AAE1JX20_9FABA|nr:hypothetical protein QN277_018991 [Acacia crassicarpa]
MDEMMMRESTYIGPVKEPLCLYGDSNGLWWVRPPPEFDPPDLDYPRQPVRGINQIRDRMSQVDWEDYVAHYSDLWILSLAYSEVTSRTFLVEQRKSLYDKIFQLPKVSEVVRNRRIRNARAQVEQVFNDFMARRRALTRALTVDSNEFYRQCDPRAGDLCLFGDTNGIWRVGPPDENVPTGLPQPERGINKDRDTMNRSTWLYGVAHNSHCWLLSVASFEAANIGLRQDDRQRVHDMIDPLRTLADIVVDYQFRAP